VFSASLVASLVLAVPHGWHTIRASPAVKASCDPVQLMVVGSRRPRLGKEGWRAPGSGQVLVFVEDDHVNKPTGALRRPRHFRVPWQHLQPLEGCCGTPGSRGWVTWFRMRRHLLGFIVFAGRGMSVARQHATERMLDSLRLR
jgi:hypothetical protein